MMLACQSYPHHLSHPHHQQQFFNNNNHQNLPSPAASQLSLFDHHSTSSPASSDYCPADRFDSLQPEPSTTSTPGQLGDSSLSMQRQQSNTYMNKSPPTSLSPQHHHNPAIHIAHSTPTPPAPSSAAFDDGAFAFGGVSTSHAQDWSLNTLAQQQQSQQQQAATSSPHTMGMTRQTPPRSVMRRKSSHRRATSASTVGSNNDPSSPYTHTTSFPQIANADQSPQHGFEPYVDADQVAAAAAASQWTAFAPAHKNSTHPPVTSASPAVSAAAMGDASYLAPPFQQPFRPFSDANAALKHALLDSHAGVDVDSPGAATVSSRHSTSSMGPASPATPRLSVAPGEHNWPRTAPHGENPSFRDLIDSWMDYLQFDEPDPDPFAQYGRSMSGVSDEELYASVALASPQTSSQQQQQPPVKRVKLNTTGLASPVAHLQMDANKMRGAGSPFTAYGDYRSATQMLGSATAAAAREKQQQAQVYAFQQQFQQQQDAQSQTTISPKEVSLDYTPQDDDSSMNAFATPTSAADRVQHQAWATSQPAFSFGPDSSYDATTERSHSSLAVTRQPSNSTFSSASGAPAFTFSIPSNQFAYRPYSHVSQEATPEFPAHLTTMESSASEAELPSSQHSYLSSHHQHHTASTIAIDQGPTYSCTYHGCTQRFDSQDKLQRHKRDGHRSLHQPLPAKRPYPSDGAAVLSSEAIAARNSQAGPHRCERINPSTGKPCSQIFSRPYDLTRHEDTIHNARKQKVRCALCKEDKTFSRNDALTRHMRVVHPEVDFPGKHRRRGGASAIVA